MIGQRLTARLMIMRLYIGTGCALQSRDRFRGRYLEV
jgi:hypothetical protein